MRYLSCFAIALLLAACGTSGGLGQPRATLYQQLGGPQGIAAIVDTMLDIVLADPRIMEAFRDAPMKRLRLTLNEQFCVLSDGPCVYSGDPMKEVHQGLGITNAGFNALAEDVQSAMEQHGVSSRYQNKLMAKLAAMQREIVTK
jgi:hemoglobin